MSLTLSWEPPSLVHQNGAILNYTLTCIPPAQSGLPPMTSVFTTAGAHTLSGLAPATLYSCSVFATNLYGNGPLATVFAITEDGGMCMNSYHFLSRLAVKLFQLLSPLFSCEQRCLPDFLCYPPPRPLLQEYIICSYYVPQEECMMSRIAIKDLVVPLISF